MPDKAILTLQDESIQFSVDLEVPTDIRFSELSPLLIRYFVGAQSMQRSSTGVTDVSFYFKGTLIPDNVTLNEMGIWDGSVIDVRRK